MLIVPDKILPYPSERLHAHNITQLFDHVNKRKLRISVYLQNAPGTQWKPAKVSNSPFSWYTTTHKITSSLYPVSFWGKGLLFYLLQPVSYQDGRVSSF